jgi:CheY-like chemotaxis protein
VGLAVDVGESPSGKASVFGADIRWFESILPSHFSFPRTCQFDELGAGVAVDPGSPSGFKQTIKRSQRLTSFGLRSRSLRQMSFAAETRSRQRTVERVAVRGRPSERNSERKFFDMKVHKVLVVDDDDSTRKMIVAVLQQAGYAADAAASGVEALSRLEATRYSAVVLDVVMPGIGGIEVMRRMASTGRHTKCVVLMSAGMESVLDDAPSALVHTKLRKPFNIKDVVEAVRGCVESLGTGETPFDNYPGKGRKE